jgi:hypothetical protein
MRSVAIGVVAGLVLAPATALAKPPDPGPGTYTETLSVTPLKLRAGEKIQVSGRGCQPGEPVDLALFSPAKQTVGTLVAGMAGIFGATVRLPADTQPGRVWVRATCTGADKRPWVMDATLAVGKAPVKITPVNVLFGLGAALAVAGFGVLARRRPARGQGRRKKPEAATRPRSRRPKRRRKAVGAGPRRRRPSVARRRRASQRRRADVPG